MSDDAFAPAADRDDRPAGDGAIDAPPPAVPAVEDSPPAAAAPSIPPPAIPPEPGTAGTTDADDARAERNKEDDRRLRTVRRSSFHFTSDLLPAVRSAHRSGMLHAHRSTPLPLPIEPMQSGAASRREEHAFAWIANVDHLDAAVGCFAKSGFDEAGMAFVPYSAKENWLERYPQAVPVMECDDDGGVVLGAAAALALADRNLRAAANVAGSEPAGALAIPAGTSPAKKKRGRRPAHVPPKNMFRDKTLMPDAERDELHVEIYKYLSWLHAKLSDVERNSVARWEAKKAAARAAAGEEGGREGHEWHDAPVEGGEEEEKKSAHGGGNRKPNGRPRGDRGIDLQDLKIVIDRMEFAFSIIPNAKREVEEAAAAAASQAEEGAKEAMAETGATAEEEDAQQGEKGVESEGGGKTQRGGGKTGKSQSSVAVAATRRPRLPFLEENLRTALRGLVATRAANGKPGRRPRKRKPKRKADMMVGQVEEKGSKGRIRLENKLEKLERLTREADAKFEELFQRLVRYREVHGDCSVPFKFREDMELGHFVKTMREKRNMLRRRGIEGGEVPAKGKHPSLRILTDQRLARLESIGFAWIVGKVKEEWVPWEEHFAQMVEYYRENGKWPSQTMGRLGTWVHRQRQKHARGDKKFMARYAPRMDEVGFEWTPRGNTGLTFDEGFDMLMEYGRINGTYDVPAHGADGKPLDRRSDEYRLHKWVESLHSMYRSYKLGRQPGSLDDERVLLLIKNGFEFRSG